MLAVGPSNPPGSTLGLHGVPTMGDPVPDTQVSDVAPQNRNRRRRRGGSSRPRVRGLILDGRMVCTERHR